MQEALKIIENWCRRIDLIVNRSKTTLFYFTSRSNTVSYKNLRIFDKTLHVSGEVKYLGVVLDSRLTWKAHLDKVTLKAMTFEVQLKPVGVGRHGVFAKTTKA